MLSVFPIVIAATQYNITNNGRFCPTLSNRLSKQKHSQLLLLCLFVCLFVCWFVGFCCYLTVIVNGIGIVNATVVIVYNNKQTNKQAKKQTTTTTTTTTQKQ